MNQQELNKILQDHKLWRESYCKKGVRADLQGANLQGADLGGANLRYALLSGADLRGADLQRANLRDANLRDADLSGAYLCGANLSHAQFELEISRAKYLNACIMSWTQSCWVTCHEDFKTIKFV